MNDKKKDLYFWGEDTITEQPEENRKEKLNCEGRASRFGGDRERGDQEGVSVSHIDPRGNHARDLNAIVLDRKSRSREGGNELVNLKKTSGSSPLPGEG